MTTKRMTMIALTTLAVGLGLTACSDDDGEAVRDCPSGSESGASGTEADASGSEAECPSGSASGSASGSTAAVCDPFGNSADADTTVNATLGEYTIALDAASAPAGKVHFAVENAGAEVHEIVVVRADSVADLPIGDDGALAEDELPEGTLIGEVEGFPAGETCDGTFDLAAGDYVLLCNIVEEEDDGSIEAHVKEGMVTTFEVT